MRPLKTILHPTDFSQHSEQALALAGVLARDQGARLVIIHAVPMAAPVPTAGDAAALVRAEHWSADFESYRQEMREKLDRIDVPALPGNVERFLEQGDPATVILGKAKAKACDLIVMGRLGQTGLENGLMGSVAEEVIRKAPCPVLTLSISRPKEPGADSPVSETTSRVFSAS